MILDCREIDPAQLGRKIEPDEMRRLQLDMLDMLVDYCEKHGLTYYLSGGTLLGAVRHKGFIPWDDDIDVNMPRPDVDRLIELTGGVLNDHIEIASPLGPVPHATGFVRICDKRYIINSRSRDGKTSYYTNLFVDVFPIEGLPTNRKMVRLHYWLASGLIIMRLLAYFKGVAGPMSFQKCMRYAMRPLAKLMGYRFWNRALLRVARLYKYDKCDYVGVVTSNFHTVEEYIEREGYGIPVKLEFEGKLYNAPANYDKYLTNLYGDYMQPPPQAERGVHHHFTVYENKAFGL